MNPKKPTFTTFVSTIAFLAAVPLAAENILQVGYGEGEVGDGGIPLIITAETDQPIHGYSIALSFPADVLQVQDLGVKGTHVQTLEPEYEQAKVDNALGIATLGVIIDFDAPVEPNRLSTTDDGQTRKPAHIVARLLCNVRPDAPGGVHAIRLVDGVGTPASFNRFTNAGESITPTTVDGTFVVDGGNVMSLSSSIAIAGATPNLRVTASVLNPDPLDGFSVAIAFDCSTDTIEFKSSTWVGTDLDFLVGQPEFYSSGESDSYPCRVETAAAFEFVRPIDASRKLPPSTGNDFQSIMYYNFAVGSAADDVQQWQDLTLENLDDPVATNNIFIVGPQSVQPRRIHGKVFFSNGDLTGHVVEEMSGADVSNATISLSPNPCADDAVGCVDTVTTDASGVFAFAGLTPGVYAVKISKAGYYDVLHENVLIEGGFATSDAGDLAIYRIPSGGSGGKDFIRGDANTDTRRDISDAVFLLNYMFQGLRPPSCFQAADANDDNRVDISDAIYVLNHFFRGMAAIPPPSTCGPDPTPSDPPLECESNTCGS